MMAIAWAWSCCWRLADTGGGPGEGDGVPGTAGAGLYAASFAWSACHCWCTGSSFAFASASEATMCESAGPLANAASRIAWMDSSIWSTRAKNAAAAGLVSGRHFSASRARYSVTRRWW
ncbi:MAG: hypothetical protein AUG44_25085 [Actinobacteria bacterium 13_1_20CM_3_71_11]|nr:MAG: hypothetical protein AUG44_25085 [Actinobacteria bacterium 13_1_20CM_3_71_11]